MIEFGPLPAPVHVFPALPVDTYRDGDTFYCRTLIDLPVLPYPIVAGDVDEPVRIRTWGVSCPEVRGAERPAGLAARAFTYAWLAEVSEAGGEWPLWIQPMTTKVDAFGRVLCAVYSADGRRCLNRELLESGYGREDVRP